METAANDFYLANNYSIPQKILDDWGNTPITLLNSWNSHLSDIAGFLMGQWLPEDSTGLAVVKRARGNFRLSLLDKKSPEGGAPPQL